MTDRWATFDCYGTIADWHGGMRGALRGLVGRPRRRAARRLPPHEPVVEAERPHRLYRDVLAEALRRGRPEHRSAARRGRCALVRALERDRRLDDDEPAVSRGARRGLASRRAHELRRRPVRRHGAQVPRAVRPGRDGPVRPRLQAGARPLPDFRARHGRDARGLGARRVQLLPRHRTGARARSPAHLGRPRSHRGGSGDRERRADHLRRPARDPRARPHEPVPSCAARLAQAAARPGGGRRRRPSSGTSSR